VSYK